ncbi:MAG: fibrobacter succinogenes major paralogous domain-containing protein, partial [Prevotella sp.]|nr:fibrobacter succinogenes major paralogous domain-containing protein [Prevotella sp.]
KYYKYKVGNVTSTPGDIIVNAYLDKAINKDWGSIPCADDNTLLTGRDKNSLSGLHYKGDICKYLSDNRLTNGSGLISEWRMPVSNMFAGDDTYHSYPYEPDGSVWKRHDGWSGSGSFIEGIKENGSSQTEDAFVTYKYSPTGETVYFPASGNRNSGNGELVNVGSAGSYWSASAANGPNAYNLVFDYSYMFSSYSYNRENGFSVRCVRL